MQYLTTFERAAQRDTLHLVIRTTWETRFQTVNDSLLLDLYAFYDMAGLHQLFRLSLTAPMSEIEEFMENRLDGDELGEEVESARGEIPAADLDTLAASRFEVARQDSEVAKGKKEAYQSAFKEGYDEGAELSRHALRVAIRSVWETRVNSMFSRLKALKDVDRLREALNFCLTAELPEIGKRFY